MNSLGLAGCDELRQTLETCEDPVVAINEFQSHNSIEVASLQPALKLLDLHNIKRLDYHSELLLDLVGMLLKQIQKLSQSTNKKDTKLIEKLLDQTFPLSCIPQIKPIVLETLAGLKHIPKSYLKKIINNDSLYKDVSVEVKQQLWLMDLSLFLKEVTPHVQNFVKERQSQLINIESKTVASFFGSNTKLRRGCSQVQTLLKMVGDKEVLYDRVMQYIRQEFAQNKCAHLCSLRYELLMGVHDSERRALTELDPCHPFAWCIDPCIRERHLDNKHILELKIFLDGLKKKDCSIWADMCMLCADSHMMHFMGLLLTKVINHCAQEESLPRDQHSLDMLLRILALGTSTHKIHQDKEFKEPRVSGSISTEFMAELVGFVVEDNGRMELESAKNNVKTLVDEVVGTGADIETMQKLIDESCRESLEVLKKFISGGDKLCAWVFAYYIFDLMGKKKNVEALRRYVPLLQLCPHVAYSNHFLFIFISKLINLYMDNHPMKPVPSAAGTSNPPLPAVITSPNVNDFALDCKEITPITSQINKFEELILEQFLLVDNENVKPHLLRLVNHCADKMEPSRLCSVMSFLNPENDKDTNENYLNAFCKVQTKYADMCKASV